MEVNGTNSSTAKEVVAQLAINPNTVLKAYRELEREGLVAAQPGLGTFVQRSLGGASLAEHTRLRRQLANWCATAGGPVWIRRTWRRCSPRCCSTRFREGIA